MYDESQALRWDSETEQANITVEIGDYRLTATGLLEPPSMTEIRNDLDEYSDYLHQGNYKIPPQSWTTMIMRLVKPENVKIERFRWIIPIERKTRIEE